MTQSDSIRSDVAELRQLLDGGLTSVRQAVLQATAGRTIVFVDNTNLNRTLSRISRDYQMCYERLMHFLGAGRFVKQVRIYYSDFHRNAAVPPREAQKREGREKFYCYLRGRGYWLKRCEQVERDGKLHEKGLDASVVKDMSRLCANGSCDSAVLVSGDGDYKDTVAEVRNLYGVNVDVAFFEEYTSKPLMREAARFINLDAAKEELRDIKR